MVGGTTRGGGYRCDEVRINPLFLLSVSTLRVVSTFTDSWFQGIGVIPDINVAEKKALETALEDAERRIRAEAR